MTDIPSVAPSAGVASASGLGALRRAFLVDLCLNSRTATATLFTCGISLVLAAFFTDGFAGLLPIWAALAWYRYGRGDTIGRQELRASLGMTRADRVRGRVALIAVESVVILLTMGAATLITVALGHDSTGTGPTLKVSTGPGVSTLVTTVVAVLYAGLVLLLTGILMGADCLTRRPGWGAAVLSVLIYFLAGLLGAFVLMLPLMLLTWSRVDDLIGAVLAIAVLLGAFAVLTIVLRSRMRAWIRQLDSGVRQRLGTIT